MNDRDEREKALEDEGYKDSRANAPRMDERKIVLKDECYENSSVNTPRRDDSRLLEDDADNGKIDVIQCHDVKLDERLELSDVEGHT